MSKYRSSRRRPRKKKNNKKRNIALLTLFAVITVIIVGYIMLGTNGSNENSNLSQMKVLLETNMGNIKIQLRSDMPITTTNFKNLVQQGVYDNTIFHRVISDFMIQGGDPFGTGQGDPSIPDIQDELSESPENRKNLRGTISMAKKGDPITGRAIANSASSQFFINVVNNSNEIFDEDYPVFGDVIEGIEVADIISEVTTDDNDKPLEDVILVKASIIE